MNTKNPEFPIKGSEDMLSKDPVIEIKNLKKSFGTQEVLKNITLKLYNGENLVVLGKSGTGKSVLIKCIVVFLPVFLYRQIFYYRGEEVFG